VQELLAGVGAFSFAITKIDTKPSVTSPRKPRSLCRLSMEDTDEISLKLYTFDVASLRLEAVSVAGTAC
jgi:hypothetical protein